MEHKPLSYSHPACGSLQPGGNPCDQFLEGSSLYRTHTRITHAASAIRSELGIIMSSFHVKKVRLKTGHGAVLGAGIQTPGCLTPEPPRVLPYHPPFP